MRVFLEILSFELRQQLRSPFVLMVLVLFFLVHFLTVTSTGINLWAHPLANVNSAYAIAVTETTLSVFGMLPVIVFVAKAILRDHDSKTAELLFVKPIGKEQYLCGRFLAACLLATLVGLCGLLGTVTGTLMPWLDQERVAPFSIQPFLFCFFAIVVPTMLIQSALFFSVAALSRSLATAVGLALLVIVGDFALANVVLSRTSGSGAHLFALADHSATLVVAASTRSLTVVELNSFFPDALLIENRLLWFAIAGAVLAYACHRFRFETREESSSSSHPLALSLSKGSLDLAPSTQNPSTSSGRTDQAKKYAWIPALVSQLRMDFLSVLLSPLFLLILALGVFSTINEHNANLSPLMNLPYYPLTSTMLGFFRFGLIQFAWIITIYYSGALLHRERESGIASIVGASPFPDWILPLSKTLVLCSVVALLLATTMITSIGIQLVDGYTNLELGVYLRAVFLHTGFDFWMLCVLAIFVQTAISNKWLGTLLLLATYVLLLSLKPLGYEHILYRFTIPYVIHSDMNGIGDIGRQINSLIVYWGCFCGLLLVGARLIYPRGEYSTPRDRAREAKARFNGRIVAISFAFAVGFLVAGGWIFYNTNVLNTYRTEEDSQRAQAEYEIKYGQYENRPAPSFAEIDMAVELFPADRRLESSGMASIRNNKGKPIEEFVVSVSPKMQIAELNIATARKTLADAEQGFYLFVLDKPLPPGMTTSMTWKMSRTNRGFSNSDPDTEIVENGTFVMGLTVVPVPGFADTRKVTDNALRKKFGLQPSPQLPALGDPEFLDNLAVGVDSLSDVRVVIGTDADQIAVTSGELKREWHANGRRYFEYISERPILPGLPIQSGRYKVARDRWNDVSLEVYYDPKHPYNIDAMLETTKRSLDYFTRAFSPYPYAQFRIVEYPRYRSAVKALPGGVAYSETGGFILNLESIGNLDYATIHELAHTWWGSQVYGARMQGREMLNETLAQYATLMVFKHFGEERDDLTLMHRIIVQSQRGYLAGRNADGRPELPLMRTDDQGNISYNKGPLAFFALQEVIGEDAVNRALQSFLAKYSFKPAPFPTSRDLVNELRAVAGPEHQDVITNWFEKIVLYDLQMDDSTVRLVGDEYEVELAVSAKQFEADGVGRETEVPLQAWIDVAVFANAGPPPEGEVPLYLKKHRLKSGANTVVVRVPQKPGYATLDPYRKMPDRSPDDNGQVVADR